MTNNASGGYGLFDFLNPQPRGGLLGEPMSPEEMMRQRQQQGLMGLAQGLLAASGPSRMPVSFGQALGQGMQQMQAANQDFDQTALMRQRLQQGSEAPSNVREWEYYSKLPQPQQQEYLKMKRAEQFLNLGDKYVQPGPGGTALNSYQRGLPPEQSPALKRDQAFSTEQGKADAEFQQGYGGAQAKADYTIKLIDELIGNEQKGIKEHPGLRAAVGLSSVIPNRPGGDAKSFENRLSQIQGRQFLEAFESLKGGGQITQIEGEKATQAISRMQASNSEKEFVEAAKEFRGIVEGAMKRSQSRMEGQAAPVNLNRDGQILDIFGGGAPAPTSPVNYKDRYGLE